ncbi:MAG: hypothetical protein Q9163_000365 [Psora crenata]
MPTLVRTAEPGNMLSKEPYKGLLKGGDCYDQQEEEMLRKQEGELLRKQEAHPVMAGAK